MFRSTRELCASASLAMVALLAACDTPGTAPAVTAIQPSASVAADPSGAAVIQFTPLPTSAVCTVSGGDPVNPLVLGAGLSQTLVAGETQFLLDIPDMHAFNETGTDAYRYLYRVHEISGNGGVSRTDLLTGTTSLLLQRADWERLDPIRWTPWGTLLFGEEAGSAAFRDPAVPNAIKGLMYELNPTTLAVSARPALGSKAHTSPSRANSASFALRSLAPPPA